MAPGALPGFRDFYPAEFAERAHIFAAWRDVARRFGFSEYDGPPLEPLELYTKKSGEEIAGQLYGFTDKGGREVSLRPEMTPTLARMAAARANALRKPVRWFSIPQLFRYERQQRGRLREHFQLNMDILGEPDVTADAELLAAAVGIMQVLGLTQQDVVARVSDRRLISALLQGNGIQASELPAAFAALDKLGRDPDEVLKDRLEKAGIDRTRSAPIFRIAGAATDRAGLETEVRDARAEAAYEPLKRYFDYVASLGIADWVRLDLSIVRGLAYYTGIVFELFDAKGELRAICGGGRYDDLLQQLGGVAMPALGFGMGDVVLGELLRDRKLMPAHEPALDFWVAFAEDVDVAIAMRVASGLRARGRSVEYALGAQKLARQLKAASTAGARQAVLLSLAEVQRGEATIKDLSDGSERHVRLEQWLATQ